MTILIETQRLIVKTPHLVDIDNWCLLLLDADVMRYIRDKPKNRSEVLKYLERDISHQTKYGFSFGSVFIRNSNIFIGRAGMSYLAYDDTQSDIEIGYSLLKEYWGQGFATELTEEFISWGFQYLNIKKLLAVANPENTKSWHVMEKVGMKYVGNALYNNQHPVRKYEIYKD